MFLAAANTMVRGFAHAYGLADKEQNTMNISLRRRAISNMARVLLIGFAAIVWLVPAYAGTITFDDLSHTEYNGALIADGYAGLNWDNFAYVNPVYVNTSGYQNGVVSAPNLGFNWNGTSASFSASSPFNFNSAYFTAAWNNGLSIDATGYNQGNPIYSTTFTVDTTGPDFMVFNWLNVDQVSFSSYGGTPAGYDGSGNHFAMDNLSINAQAVSEPSNLGMLALGLGLIGLLAWRRRHMRV